MAFSEADPRALGVLMRALQSSSRVTRVRAVSMLAHLDCDSRVQWLEDASTDADEAVSATANLVLAWVIEFDEPPWPQREDPSFDRFTEAPVDHGGLSDDPPSRWQWEYVVEVWREDGLLLGVFLATTCAEDDDHAKRIALGQAILANAAGRGDAFDASAAAAFIVGKRELTSNQDRPGRCGRGKGQAV